MKKIKIYTDGACSENPGVGGWAAVILYGAAKKEISGAAQITTNNQMEIQAVIEGLKALKETCEVEIYTDSAYVCNAFNNSWIKNWEINGWKNAQKDPVKNKEMWQELIALAAKHKTTFLKVKGHAGDEYNERCDFLATSRVAELKSQLAELAKTEE